VSTHSVLPKPKVSLDTFREAWRLTNETRKQMKTVDAETRNTIDAFQNSLARIGFGTSNLLEGTQYPLTRLSRNYILMQSLYRNNWIARKIVDGYAEDMIKNWLTLQTDLPPEKITEFDMQVRLTGVRAKLLEAIKWGRLYGGAGAVMIIKGQSDFKQMAEPLDLEAVQLDSFRGLLVFDRWSGITPSATINTDIDKPLEFGLPETYRVNTESGKSFEVHSSRVLRFCNRTLPQWEWQAEQRWGISEYEITYDELKKRDNTSWNLASMIFRANIFAISSPELQQILSGAGKSAAAQQQMYSILQAQNWLMSTQGLFVTPKDSTFSNHSYSFGGLSDLYLQFMYDICGATEYPMSKLFGRQNSNMGQSNLGDEHTYYDNVGQKQVREIDPPLFKLIPVVAMSTWGKVPDDLVWKWNPVRSLSNEEQADLAEKMVKPVLDSFNAGIIGRQTALKELKASAPATNMFTNITDEMIEAADDDVQSAGEFGDVLGGDKLDQLIGKEPDEPKGKAKETTDALVAKPRPKSLTTLFADELILEPDRPAKRSIRFAGLPIVIENPAGSIRSGYNPATGKRWQVTMQHPYGYVAGTEGADGDEVDVFLGPDEDAADVYVVRTVAGPKGNQRIDEDKVMVGFPSKAAAKKAFMANYSDPSFFGSIEAMPLAEFKKRIAEAPGTLQGDIVQGQPMTETVGRQAAANYRAKRRQGAYGRTSIPGAPAATGETKKVIAVVDAAGKFEKPEVGFEHPAKGPDHCSACKHFLSEQNACAIVKGEVLASDWCEKFSQKE